LVDAMERVESAVTVRQELGSGIPAAPEKDS